jgi:hypothetical protein
VNLDKLGNSLQFPSTTFRLTEAIRPAAENGIVPCSGYRLGIWQDDIQRLLVPVLAASVSGEQLFGAFLSLLDPLGDLETSHLSHGTDHQDLYREEIDRPVLLSHLNEFEDLLLNDGCTGIAIIDRLSPIEVQFDEHKQLLVYARDLHVFETILEEFSVARHDTLKLISEGAHLHHTEPRHRAAFRELSWRLGTVKRPEPGDG